jgi:hypothetical protein
VNAWMFLAAGIALWGVFVAVSRSLGGGSARSLVRATRTFLIAWFMVCVTNMWVGVTQSGHAASEEWPEFALIFLLPAALAVVFAAVVVRSRGE